MTERKTDGNYRCDIHDFETDSRGQMKRHIDFDHPGGAAKDHVDEFLTDKSKLADRFNDKNDCSLYEQTIKLSEESGEVSEAVLGLTGDLLFKEGATAEEVGEEIADLFATGYYVADLAGVDNLDERVLNRLQENLRRSDRSLYTGNEQ